MKCLFLELGFGGKTSVARSNFALSSHVAKRLLPELGLGGKTSVVRSSFALSPNLVKLVLLHLVQGGKISVASSRLICSPHLLQVYTPRPGFPPVVYMINTSFLRTVVRVVNILYNEVKKVGMVIYPLFSYYGKYSIAFIQG